MTIAFRVLYSVVLGGLVLLWYVDFEPGRLAVLRDPFVTAWAPEAVTKPGSRRDSLEQQLEALKAAITSLAASLPPPVDLDALERRMATLDARLNAIEGAITQDATLPPAPDISGLERRLVEIGEQVAALAVRAPNESGLSGLEARLRTIEHDLSNLSDGRIPARLSELESGINALAADPAHLANRLASLEDRLGKLAETLPTAVDTSALESRFDALDAAVAKIADRRTPAPATRELEAALTSLEVNLETRLQAVEGRVSALALRPVPSLDTTDLEARIAELASRPAPATDDAAVLAALSAIQARLDRLADRPDSVGAMELLEERLAAVEMQLAKLAETGSPPADSLALKKRLAAIDAAISRIAETAPPDLDATEIRAALTATEAAIRARLQALEVRVEEFASTPVPQPEIGNLEARIDDAATRLSEIQTRLTEVDTVGLGRRIAALQSHLDALAEAMPPAFDASGVEAHLARIDARLSEIAGSLEQQADPPPSAEAATGLRPRPEESASGQIAVTVTDEAWIRIKDGEQILFEGFLPAGERILVPNGLAAPELRAGNAGSVYLILDGAAYGPLGRPKGVVRNISLQASAIRTRWPRADSALARSPSE